VIAVVEAWALGFWRDRPGMFLTLVLPPLVYLLFAAIFGAGARGEIDATVALHDGARTARSAAIVRALEEDLGDRLHPVDDAAGVNRAVIDGRADAGVVIDAGSDGAPRIEVRSAAGRDVAASALQARLEPMAAGETAPQSPRVALIPVGPEGDVQSAYYAGAVAAMFVFFAAMHGAMGGLDERRSGLQARLALAGGGLARIVAGRAVWLTVVGVMQCVAVFAVAWSRLPPLSLWQFAATLTTAAAVGAAASGIALALVGLCRSREQAQPLTTFAALLSAALGGSMAPRFLMPELFRDLGWLTPHAWAVETFQAVVWRGEFGAQALTGWAVLVGVGLIGIALALMLERRRAAY
jgi:ABC-2 type transport system permease protein